MFTLMQSVEEEIGPANDGEGSLSTLRGNITLKVCILTLVVLSDYSTFQCHILALLALYIYQPN